MYYDNCAPEVPRALIQAISRVESANNPFAIEVIGRALVRQPTNKIEAVATARALEQKGLNYSLGQMQINRVNLVKYNISFDDAFDECTNKRLGSIILSECFYRARSRGYGSQSLNKALSCYNSGRFDTPVTEGYVSKVRSTLKKELKK
jgi:type IV secretion system protein VirB1